VDRTAFAYYPASAEADPAADGARIGVDVVGVMRDGPAEALERIGAGEASALLVAHLADAAGSLRELVALLDWLDACDGDLIALDVGLDTSTRAGTHVARVLREVERWEREPPAGRPSRGRPGLVHHSPKLADRIRSLRDAGESLQGIANLLNDEGVPTPRGGDRWRPSSVQAALGYRRPRPPGPGVPAPPPRHPPRREHVPHLPGKGPRPPAKPRPPHPRGGRP
jgi:Resolvase, N terminal domain/Recombinase